jgi:tetraprenyl-beta-curcumene synthase
MRAAHTPNTLPLTRSQCSALIAATSRQLGWGRRAVAREIRAWRADAAAIPDPELRRDALAALDDKRGHADGAALLWTLPRRRNPELLRVLVRYELLQDFLDTATEHGAAIGPRDGERLYAALLDALDLERRPVDLFVGSGRDDGGYLAALVDGCRDGCRALRGYDAVRPLLVREARRASVLPINHRVDTTARDAALERWAEQHLREERELRWFERAAAASGWITTHALFVAAADEKVTFERAAAIHAAYFPWLAMALTMLDSYADQIEDRATGDHSYVGHYETSVQAVGRLRESVARAASGVLELPNGERHAVLLACMIALYLSKDSARTSELRATTAQIAAAGGSLTRLVLPLLRAWRIRNGQRRAT